jgi:hypothetical protein
VPDDQQQPQSPPSEAPETPAPPVEQQVAPQPQPPPPPLDFGEQIAERGNVPHEIETRIIERSGER